MRKRSDRINLPDSAGVYFLFNKNRKLVYIGKANNLGRRIIAHQVNYEHFKRDKFISDVMGIKPFEYYDYIIVDKRYIKILEKKLINIFYPKYNNFQIKIPYKLPRPYPSGQRR